MPDGPPPPPPGLFEGNLPTGGDGPPPPPPGLFGGAAEAPPAEGTADSFGDVPPQPVEEEAPPQLAYPAMAEPPATGAFGAAQAFGAIIGVDEDAPVQEAAPQERAPDMPQPQQGQMPAHDLVRKNQHGDPLGRRIGRGVLKAVGGSGGPDAKLLGDFAELMSRSVPSYRQIAIASVRGGAGKTTMAALVATELARARGDRVLAADADAELGSLPLRFGLLPERSLFDLAVQNPRTFEEAMPFLSRTPDGLWVLSSTRGGKIAGEFTLETFQAALGKVARYVSAAVVDCGAGILTELNRGVLAHSHGLVLVTPATVDGALSARGALEWFVANGQQQLLAQTVIAMVAHAPQVGTDLNRAQEMLTAWGLPVVHVPYDRHVGTGASLDMSKIGGATRAAVIRVVHEVFARSLGMPGAAR
ncbi:MinD/ParA family ATP-binding protein [Spirillospora sp. CA-253888]